MAALGRPVAGAKQSCKFLIRQRSPCMAENASRALPPANEAWKSSVEFGRLGVSFPLFRREFVLAGDKRQHWDVFGCAVVQKSEALCAQWLCRLPVPCEESSAKMQFTALQDMEETLSPGVTWPSPQSSCGWLKEQLRCSGACSWRYVRF